MLDWVDIKYINLVSSNLRNFKRKSNNLFNFSCPICGDSETDTKKARGYIYDKKGVGMFHCHNCEITLTVSNFIKKLDMYLFNEMKLEKLKSSQTIKETELKEFNIKMQKPVFASAGPLKGLKKVSQLKHDHFCKEFVFSRQIPNYYQSELYFCPEFKKYVNSLILNKIENTNFDEPRLIIPFINKEGNCHAIQGRALKEVEPRYRYMTIILDDNEPKIWGLNHLDLSKNVYVFEGPIDGMFISNSIATAGGDLSLSLGALKNLNKSKTTVVLDNEPRSIYTIKKIKNALIQGFNVCIWPEAVEEKDVNDMIKSGYTPECIKDIIDSNTYNKLTGMLKLQHWGKAL